MPLPSITPKQRASALAKAAESRTARGALLAQVKSGELGLAAVRDRTDDIARKTRVVQVLRALPGHGPAKVAALLAESGADEQRRVGGLGRARRIKPLEAAAR